MSEEITTPFLDESSGSQNNISNTIGNNEEDPRFILFSFILHGIITNTVGFIGLVGNIICIIVLRRPQMRGNSTNIILSALSAFDACLIVTSMLMLGFPAIGRYSEDLISDYYYTRIYPYIMPCVYAFGLVAQTGSIYCTLGVTVERYIVICWPLRSSTICTYGRTKMAVILIALFSLLYNIPRFFEVTWDTPSPLMDANSTLVASLQNANFTSLEDEGGGYILSYSNQTDIGDSSEINVIPQPTRLRMNEIYISVYVTWMYFVFMFVLPFGCLSVLNLLIYLDVRRSNARQSTLSHHEKNELRLAVMLMTVVVVFQICNIPPLIVNILEVSGVKEIPELTQTSNLLVTVNSSVNIFIYIILGDKFKRVFLQCLSENMPCCYSGRGENGTCCPMIICERKHMRNRNSTATGATEYYMGDGFASHRTTRTTLDSNTGNFRLSQDQVTTPSSLHPTTAFQGDTQFITPPSYSLKDTNMPRRLSQEDGDERKPLLVVELQDDPTVHRHLNIPITTSNPLRNHSVDNSTVTNEISNKLEVNKKGNSCSDTAQEEYTNTNGYKKRSFGDKETHKDNVTTPNTEDRNFSTSLDGSSQIEGISAYLDSDASKHGSNNIDGSEAVNIVPTDDNDKSNDSDMMKAAYDEDNFSRTKEINHINVTSKNKVDENMVECSTEFNEKSAFLDYVDCERIVDLSNSPHSTTLTSNVIGKMSSLPATMKTLRDV